MRRLEGHQLERKIQAHADCRVHREYSRESGDFLTEINKIFSQGTEEVGLKMR